MNWEIDTKMAFLFCREALKSPLAPGSVVAIIFSGAGSGGSPISGGYAGAKRVQPMFPCGIRFLLFIGFGASSIEPKRH